MKPSEATVEAQRMDPTRAGDEIIHCTDKISLLADFIMLISPEDIIKNRSALVFFMEDIQQTLKGIADHVYDMRKEEKSEPSDSGRP